VQGHGLWWLCTWWCDGKLRPARLESRCPRSGEVPQAQRARREAFDAKHINTFLGGVLRGGIKTQPVSRFGAVEGIEGWDGKDGEMPEETPLDAYDDVKIDF